MTACRIPCAASTPREDSGAAGGAATSSLRSPIENVSDPEIGWPSAETTYQPTT